MPRRVVPIWRRPSRRSLAESMATCHGMIRWAFPRPEAFGRDATLLQLVDLTDEQARVDDAAGADDADAAGVEDPRRDVVELEGLAVADDRMTGVRPALVPADDVGVLGEQVDDLALAFVTPLRADDHGGGHRPRAYARARMGHARRRVAGEAVRLRRGRRTSRTGR